MIQPFFSIIMPAYGVEAYIEQALTDIISQTFDDWELIVVDDCSPDRSAACAEKYAEGDRRIRVVHHKENRGLAEARNTGIQEARGCYIWFPDPDDRYETTLLSEVRDSLKQNPAAVVLFGHVQEYYRAHSEFLYSNKLALTPARYTSAPQLRPRIIYLEQETHYGYAWNKVYNLAYMKEHHFTYKNLALIEDVLFNIDFFQDIDTLNILSSTPYRYAKRTNESLTNKHLANYYELHHTRIKALYEQQKTWGTLDSAAKAILGSLYGRYILSALQRNCEPESHMNHTQRIAWCKMLFEDPLFEELLTAARANHSKALALCLFFLKRKQARMCVFLGRSIHIAKTKSFTLFTKIRSDR